MSTANDIIDELEFNMQTMPNVNCKVTNCFIPGFYIRTVEMPAKDIDGNPVLVTSLVHNTQHPYHISKGVVHVVVNGDVVETLYAGDSGVTFPGTRRVLAIEEDTIWTTFHPILESEYPEHMLEEEIEMAIEKIGKRIITPHENKLIGGIIKNNVVTKAIQNENY